MKILRTTLASLLLTLSLTVLASASERETVLRSCAEMFGAPVDIKLNLFEVNRFYVLRVQFDKRGQLSELAVEPKYFFEQSHPDWEEPRDFEFLSKAEYESLLLRLDKIRPRGHLVNASLGSVVTNMTSHHKDIYQNAVLVWGELIDLRRGENAPLQVRWFRLQFSGTRIKHPVRGAMFIVADGRKSLHSFTSAMYRVRWRHLRESEQGTPKGVRKSKLRQCYKHCDSYGVRTAE